MSFPEVHNQKVRLYTQVLNRKKDVHFVICFCKLVVLSINKAIGCL